MSRGGACLLFRLGDRPFGLPLDQVGEIAPVERLHPVPLAPRPVLGLMNLRGQVITLVAASYFLRSTVAVNVKPEGVAGVEAPRLGRINIKANPDNCEVFIDGAFVDYPPILDKAVAVGTHNVAFKWPDGTRRDEQAEVEAGSPSYVMGRKD